MEKREIVICDGEVAKSAHMELFRLCDGVYLTIPSGPDPGDGRPDLFAAIGDFIELCKSSSHDPFSAQLVLTWPNLLRLCLWKAEAPVPEEALNLLEDSGMKEDELGPLRTANVDEIFRLIYHGKRFDILRRLCHAARSRIESRLGDGRCDIVCHVVAEDTKRIVASSL